MKNVLLVTGASRGIGAAAAGLAASRGYSVAINYRSSQRHAEELAKRLRAQGAEAIPIQADVSSREQVQAMFGEIDRRLGRVTALVNNAGILEKQARLESVDPARLHRLFSTNVFGAMYCAQEAIQRMSTAKGGAGGAIVNVSSVAARLGSPGEYVDYAATKGALDSFTIGLARELAPEGIRVNAVRPGFIYTGIHADGGEPGRVDRVKHVLPLRRGGQPAEVAHAILWLLSPEASYTTGAFIELAGGQ